MYGCAESVTVDRAIGSVFCWARKCSIGAFLLTMMVSASEAAAERTAGLYVRASAVESSLDVDGMAPVLRKSILLTPPVEQFKDQRSTGWSIAAGWRFQRNFAVEAGFSDFGEKTLASSQDVEIYATNTTRSSTITVIRGNTHVDVTGFHFAIVGSVPLGNWEPYVKLGVLGVETTARSPTVTTFSIWWGSGMGSTVTGGVNEVTASTTEVLGAIGLSYAIADHYGINLEAARIPKVGSEQRTGEGDLTALSLALEYRF